MALAALVVLAYTGLTGERPGGRDRPPPAQAETIRTEAAPRDGTFSLADHEARPGSRQGGHTIERHVGRTEEQLRARLRDEPGISAASSFESLDKAEHFIALALAANKAKIDAWLARGEAGSREAFNWSNGEVVGYGVVRATDKLTQMRRLRLVLKLESYNGQRYFILTAYPNP